MNDTSFLLWATEQMKEGKVKLPEIGELRRKYPGMDWVLDVLPFILVFNLDPEVIVTWLDKRTIKEVEIARGWCITKVLKDTDPTLEVDVMPDFLKQLEA